MITFVPCNIFERIWYSEFILACLKKLGIYLVVRQWRSSRRLASAVAGSWLKDQLSGIFNPKLTLRWAGNTTIVIDWNWMLVIFLILCYRCSLWVFKNLWEKINLSTASLYSHDKHLQAQSQITQTCCQSWLPYLFTAIEKRLIFYLCL